MIELAWLWLRHQPDFGVEPLVSGEDAAKGRVRRIAIVALARKLLVALWRYVTQGVVPEAPWSKACIIRWLYPDPPPTRQRWLDELTPFQRS